MIENSKIDLKIVCVIILFVFTILLNAAAEDKKETVIVLHGIFNRSFMMNKIKNGLEKEGYKVINWGYPSNKYTIEEHAAALDKVIRQVGNNEPISFVGFSLGSIIIRYYLSNYNVPNVQRFVMVAPPNHGSEKVDFLYKNNFVGSIFGEKSFKQLQVKNKDYFSKIGVPSCEIGIIAGGRRNAKGYSMILPGDDDGAVSLKSAMLDEAKDFIQLKGEHTELLFRQETLDNILNFIKDGKFLKKEGENGKFK